MINILGNQYQIDEKWCFSALKKYILPSHKVVIIPFSFYDQSFHSVETWRAAYGKIDGRYYSEIVNPLLSYGINEASIHWVNYFEDTKAEAKRKIQEADILYFTGGLPDKMMDRLIEFNLIDAIREHSGIVIGFSAGAMIQMGTYHVTPDEDYESFGFYRGLGLIDTFDIEVHFEHTRLQLDCIHKAIEKTGLPIYAMEENGALAVDHGKVTKLGRVHYYS
jgi:peptidase E